MCAASRVAIPAVARAAQDLARATAAMCVSARAVGGIVSRVAAIRGMGFKVSQKSAYLYYVESWMDEGAS